MKPEKKYISYHKTTCFSLPHRQLSFFLFSAIHLLPIVQSAKKRERVYLGNRSASSTASLKLFHRNGCYIVWMNEIFCLFVLAHFFAVWKLTFLFTEKIFIGEIFACIVLICANRSRLAEFFHSHFLSHSTCWWPALNWAEKNRYDSKACEWIRLTLTWVYVRHSPGV